MPVDHSARCCSRCLQGICPENPRIGRPSRLAKGLAIRTQTTRAPRRGRRRTEASPSVASPADGTKSSHTDRKIHVETTMYYLRTSTIFTPKAIPSSLSHHQYVCVFFLYPKRIPYND